MLIRRVLATIITVLMIVTMFPVDSFASASVSPELTAITGSAKGSSAIQPPSILPTVVPVSNIKLNKSSISLYKGKCFKLKAKVLPSVANNKKVIWKSSNKKVATVSANGKVIAKKKGTAIITCMARDGSGKKATCKVTVKIRVTRVKLNKTTLSLKKGKTYKLKAKINPTNANNKKVKWRSSNKKVATVSSSGKVTAKGKGTATITCTAKDGSGKKATCKVKVTASSNGSAATKVSDAYEDSSSSDDDNSYDDGDSESSGNGYSYDDGGSSSGSESDFVWISSTGSKYHSKNNCGTMNPSKAKKMSRQEAENSGYEPCKKCY